MKKHNVKSMKQMESNENITYPYATPIVGIDTKAIMDRARASLPAKIRSMTVEVIKGVDIEKSPDLTLPSKEITDRLDQLALDNKKIKEENKQLKSIINEVIEETIANAEPREVAGTEAEAESTSEDPEAGTTDESEGDPADSSEDRKEA